MLQLGTHLECRDQEKTVKYKVVCSEGGAGFKPSVSIKKLLVSFAEFPNKCEIQNAG